VLRFAAGAFTGIANVLAFYWDQLGLSSITGREFWLLAVEALVVTGLLGWALSAMNLPPVKKRSFWLSVSLLVLLVLLQAHQISTPARARPNLEAQIAGAVYSDLKQTGGPQLLVVPTVTIRNTGEPSVVERFDLSIHLPNGTTIHGDRQGIPERLEIPFADGSALVVFGDDSLERRTSHPIPRGGIASGRLAYVFPSLRSDELGTEGAFCQLTMIDEWGYPYATPLTGTGSFYGSAAEVRDIVGLRSEIRSR
jgi:hypothetical protein